MLVNYTFTELDRVYTTCIFLLLQRLLGGLTVNVVMIFSLFFVSNVEIKRNFSVYIW